MKTVQFSVGAAVRGGMYRPTVSLRARGTNPGWWAIPIATIAALALVPLDPTPQGALVPAAWALALGFLGTVAMDMAVRGWERVFRAENVIMAGCVIVIFPELLQPFYKNVLVREYVTQTILAIGTFGASLALGNSFAPPRIPKSIVDLAQRQYSSAILFRIMMTCWLLTMLNYFWASNFSVSTVVAGLMSSRFGAAWARGSMGGWEAFRDFLSNFGHLVPIFTVLMVLRERRWGSSKVITGLICSSISILFIAQSGGRRLLVAVVGATLLTWVFLNRRRLRPEHVVFAAILIGITAVGMEFVLQVRSQGIGRMLESNKEVDVEGLHVDNNFYALGETLRNVPGVVDHVGVQLFEYVLVRPIPRVLWPNKPTSSGFDLAPLVGLRGLSISITSVGEFYVSYGWSGIIIGGIFMGWLARWWSQLIEYDFGVTGAALYGLGAMALFLGVRSLLELVLMSYPVICWYGVDRLLWRWAKTKSKGPISAANRFQLQQP
ncbi:MAG: O-antigen polymerase [Fimbriimonadaceae bacterium]